MRRKTVLKIKATKKGNINVHKYDNNNKESVPIESTQCKK